MRINSNTMANTASRNLGVSQGALTKSLERLSSGMRINRAADDSAGLVISQGLRAQISGLRQASRNAQDGVSVVQTAEGALNEVQNMLSRMRDLAVQAANTGTNDTNARAAANAEVTALRSEIDRITATTSFGSQKLLDGSFGKVAGVATAFDANNSIVITAGDTVNVAVTGGSGSPLSVGLTAGTYTGASFAAMVQGAARGVLSASADAVEQAASSNFSVSSTTVGAGSQITYSNLGTAAIAITDGTGTPLVDAFVTGATGIGTVAAATGSGGAFQVGSGNTGNDQIAVSISAITASGLGILPVDVSTGTGATTAIGLLDAAITTVSTTRGNLGAVQNRFESAIANLGVATENLTASESRIRDTDMSSEMTNFTKNQILQQAGTAMLAQANQIPQTVLKLLG